MLLNQSRHYLSWHTQVWPGQTAKNRAASKHHNQNHIQVGQPVIIRYSERSVVHKARESEQEKSLEALLLWQICWGAAESTSDIFLPITFDLRLSDSFGRMWEEELCLFLTDMFVCVQRGHFISPCQGRTDHLWFQIVWLRRSYGLKDYVVRGQRWLDMALASWMWYFKSSWGDFCPQT